MTILYEGFSGNPPSIISQLLIIGATVVLFILFIIGLIHKIEGSEGIIAFVIIFGFLSFVVSLDTRVPIVKATVNEEISWQEINDKYELAKQEGQIYIFKVKNTTIEEWENYLKEKENK